MSSAASLAKYPKMSSDASLIRKRYALGRRLRASVFCFALFFAFAADARADIVINEIAWMGTADSPNAEWIELFNTGSSAADLSGYGLYEGGGSVLIRELSKVVPAGGYLLIERTTPSVADPVPGVDHESGTFGGSGLSNAGEHLVLKNVSGATVSSASFASGWPAGDASTKETMQRAGSGWITASATPARANASSGSSGGDEDDEEESAPSGAGSGESEKEPVTLSLGLSLVGGRYVREPLVFAAVPASSDGRQHASGTVRWNMGDGREAVMSPADRFIYAYDRPGEYIVVAEYRKATSFIDAVDASARMTVSVRESPVSIAPVSGGVEIKNEAGEEADISGWMIASGSRRFIFPKNSIVAGSGSIVVPSARLGFSESEARAASLLYADGSLVSVQEPRQPAAASSVSSVAAPVASEPRAAAAPVADTVMLAQASAGSEAVPKASRRALYMLGAMAAAGIAAASVILLRRERAAAENRAYGFEIAEGE